MKLSYFAWNPGNKNIGEKTTQDMAWYTLNNYNASTAWILQVGQWTAQYVTHNSSRESSPLNTPTGSVARSLNLRFLGAEPPNTDKDIQCKDRTDMIFTVSKLAVAGRQTLH